MGEDENGWYYLVWGEAIGAPPSFGLGVMIEDVPKDQKSASRSIDPLDKNLLEIIRRSLFGEDYGGFLESIQKTKTFLARDNQRRYRLFAGDVPGDQADVIEVEVNAGKGKTKELMRELINKGPQEEKYAAQQLRDSWKLITKGLSGTVDESSKEGKCPPKTKESS
ncbi:hypothetical protein BDY21DRAFT_351614 [Lineolata rhizophorae]|uniref:Uncharacterized protein n=1 Tax=Lineolata rhizophorae TaxID=578093 RepID=A0A6A6NSL5_9PEZI|nr:hypothetical protein BDY21DRAFT_351614 [Lineolata rhizophorae]